MSEKTLRRTYWLSTSLLTAGMVGAAIQEIRHAPEILEAASRLGYPLYFITLLGIAKLIGAPLLLVQKFPRFKEWVYAGFSFDFGGAIISHSVVGDTPAQTSPAIFFAALLALSYYSYRARRPVISSANSIPLIADPVGDGGPAADGLTR